MNIEIRSADTAVVSGYVNAVERFSRPIRSVGRSFIEKVKAGTFGNAISKAGSEQRDIPLLIDHIKTKRVAGTSDGSLELREDNIGLYAKATIKDPDTVSELRSKGARGWSFGFVPLKDSFTATEDQEQRTLEEIKLNEVTLIVNKSPAYTAMSVEVRDNEEITEEIRSIEEQTESKVTYEEPKPEEKTEEKREQFSLDAYKAKIEVLKLL